VNAPATTIASVQAPARLPERSNTTPEAKKSATQPLHFSDALQHARKVSGEQVTVAGAKQSHGTPQGLRSLPATDGSTLDLAPLEMTDGRQSTCEVEALVGTLNTAPSDSLAVTGDPESPVVTAIDDIIAATDHPMEDTSVADSSSETEPKGAVGKSHAATKGRAGLRAQAVDETSDAVQTGPEAGTSLQSNPQVALTFVIADTDSAGKPAALNEQTIVENSTTADITSLSTAKAMKSDSKPLPSERVRANSLALHPGLERPTAADGEIESPGSDVSEAVTKVLHGSRLSIKEVPTSAVSFQPSIQMSFQYAHGNMTPLRDDFMEVSPRVIESSPTLVTASAVRHLEIAVDDPVLGNVGVRAELRGGVLHASISAADNIASTAPQLHLFLQHHDVALQSLSFTAAGSNIPQPYGSTAVMATSESANGSFVFDQSSAQQRGNPESGTQSKAAASNGDDDVRRIPVTATPNAMNAVRAGSTLSIHI